MTYLRIALLFLAVQLCTNQIGAKDFFPFTSIVINPISPMDGDTDNDGFPDFVDQDSDNDGILDMDEGVVCSTIDLSAENGNPDALNTFNNAMITVGGPNGAIIQIEDPLELNGSAMQDEFIISNEHVLASGNDSTSLLLGVDHAPGETGPSNSLGTNYTFSMPVCQFNFVLYDIDRTDEVAILGTLDGVQVPFTIVSQGVCLNYNPGTPSFNSICDVQANPGNGNVSEHRVSIIFDGCIDRLEFDIFDFAVGNGGSFTFLPAPEPVCVAFDTDMDGIPDAFDLDSDNDGIPDAIEACGELGLVLEDCTLDSNGDGVYSAVPGVLEGVCATAPEDFDGDGIPNFIDLDSDGDGCGDATEGGTTGNPNVTDSGVSDGYMIPAAGVDDCGLVLNGGMSDCPIPADDIFLDDTVDGCAVPMGGMITLEKMGTLDVGADGVASVGDIITYTFEVCNTGPVEVTAISVMDPLVTVMGGPIATLAAGACDNTTFTGTYALVQTDLDNLMVPNTATADGTDENGDPVSATGDDTVPIPVASGLTLMKTGTFNDENGSGTADEGETISYVFTVTNTGNAPISNLTITDPIVTIVGGPITLAAGASDNITFTGTYTITATDIANGMVPNTATATGEDPIGDPVMTTDDDTVPLASGTPEIDLIKTGTFNDENGSGTAEEGETISYAFTVSNIGTVDLTAVTITDPLLTVSGGPIDLIVGASDNTSFTGTYTITATDVANGMVPNTATTTGDDPGGNSVSDTDDETITFIAATPGIEVEKTSTFNDTDGNGFADVGETINYTFIISNTGNVDLTGITVTDPVITVAGGPLALLPAGQTDNTTFTGTYTLVMADIDNGSFMNTAMVVGMDPSGNPIGDDDDEMTPLPQAPGSIDLLKVGTLNDLNGDGFAQAGETIGYVFTVTNTGSTTITNILIDDPLVTVMGGPILSLAPGQVDNTTFTGVLTVTQQDIDSGGIINSAITTGTDSSGDPVTDTSDDPNNPTDVDPDGDGNPDDPTLTGTPQNPDISVAKTGVFNDENGDGFGQVGETLSYTFVVTNTGNVTLTNISITDPLVAISGTPIASLAPGDSDGTSFTGSYTLTQADIDAGEFENIALASGTDPNGNPVEDDSDDPFNPADVDPDGDGDPDDPTITPIGQNPDISLLKIGTFNDENGDGFGQPGETFTYSFVVTNTGNITLTDVDVSDALVGVMGTPIPILLPGESNSTNFTAQLVLTQADIDAGLIINTATASGADPEGNPTEDVSDDPNDPTDIDPDGDGDPDDPTITLSPANPDISIIKIGNFNDENGDGLGQPGETISYSFTVENTGNVTLTNVTVFDPQFPVTGGPIATLSPGDIDATTFTGLYVLTQADVDEGLIENLATATGTDPSGNPVEDDSDDPLNPANEDPDGDGDPDDPTIVTVGQEPLIEIIKIGTLQDQNGDGFADAGETIVYQFIITNTGNVTLFNIEVEDALVTISGMQIPILAPGDVNGSLTGVYTLTPADLAGLEIINTATALGIDPDGVLVMDISDDPTNPTDIDPEMDGEPDDPTVVPICGIQLDMLTGPIPQCFDGQVLNVASLGTFLAPDGFEVLYVLTSQPGNIIEQVSTTPSNFVVPTPGLYAIHSFIAEVDDPQDPNFVDLSMVTFGVTPAIDLLNFIQSEGICADLDLVGTPKDVQICNVNLTKQQVGEELFEDEDVALTFDFVVTNNGGFDLENFDLIDDLVFLPAADPTTPLNDNNVEITFTNISATSLPNANPDYDGISNLNIFDGMSGFLQPGESFVVSITTETSVFRFRQEFDSFQINTALVRATHVDPQGNPIIDVDDISDDPTVFTDVDIDNDGDPDDPTPIVVPVCDELVCNNDLVISLPSDCELEVTPDILLESPAPLGNFEITFFDEAGNDLGNVLTADVAFVTLDFNVLCGSGSCWGEVIIEANNIPDFNAPCEMNADGTIPDDCIILCEAEILPDIILTEEDVREAFGDCGPTLLTFNSREERTGDLCDPDGEIVKIFYTGKVERHGRIEEVDILVQQFAVTTLNLDVDANGGIDIVFGFPDDVLLNCDEEPSVELDPSIERYSPEFLQAIIPGFDAFPFFYDLRSTIADTIITADTTQVVDESMQTVRDTMVQQDLDGDGVDEWVVIRVVDKPLIDFISFDTVINNFAHPKIPIFNVNCNAASSYADVEFETCGGGIKIVREWVVLDWCDADIFITGNQSIEVRDITAPQVVVESGGELVPVSMLNDVQVSIDPWTCSAVLQLPELNVIDNCDPDPTVVFDAEEGVVNGNTVVDLWFGMDPIKITGTVSDDCGNSSDVMFNVIVIDDVPPIAICNTSLQVSLNGANGVATLFAEDIDEESHDSDCGKVTLSVVRVDDYTEVVRDCQDRVVGFRPTSCNPHTNDVDLGRAVKDDCVLSGEDIGQITVAGEFVSFCCADVGQIVPVLLIVEDERGNINQCLVDIEVVDNSSPTIVCTDQTIDCDSGDELLVPAMVGAECVVEYPFEVELLNESRSNGVCDGGQVVREWFIDIDKSGDFNAGDAFCTQIVSVSNADIFDPNTIRWPKHYDGDLVPGINIECTDGNEPIEQAQSIQMGDAFTCTPDEVTNEPVWCDTDCGLVGFTMESDTVRASDACLKIIRRWTIVDWCLFVPNGPATDDENDTATDRFEAVEDWAQGECKFCANGSTLTSDPVYFRYTNVDLDGFYTFDQIIVVNDDSVPEITVDSEFEVNTSSSGADKDEAECLGSAIVEASAVDFCAGNLTGANLLQWQITVLNENQTEVIATKTSRGAEATMMTPVGSPGDVFIIRWNVSDGCGNESTSITQVIYADRQAPTPICISALTSSFVGEQGVVVWAEEFEFGSFDNCTSSEDLTFSIVRRGQDPIAPGDAGFSDQRSLTIDCDTPSNFNELLVFVWDEDGNGDFCEVSIIVDGDCDLEGGETVGSSILITGQVNTMDAQVLADVLMTIESNQTEFPLDELTDFNGEYAFSDLKTEESYEVSAFKSDTYINGVSTLDLIRIQQHIIGLQSFDDPYAIIAADVNKDQSVTAADILELRRLVLGQVDMLDATEAWMFVDATDVFFDPSNPWPHTESIAINNLRSSVLNGDFVGIKVGDVNMSVDIPGLQSSEIRSNSLIEFSSDNTTVKKGEQVTVAMSAQDFELYGLQFTLQHQGLIVQDAQVNGVSLDDSQIGLFDDRTTISWMDLDPSNEMEIVMTFTATQDVEIAESLFFNSSITKAEAYVTSDLEVANINLIFNESIDQFTLYQNVPNPFSEETLIQFATNLAGQANIYIMNVNGQQVYRSNMQVTPGTHQFTINRDILNTSGIYYYQVEVNGNNQTKKLIVLDR